LRLGERIHVDAGDGGPVSSLVVGDAVDDGEGDQLRSVVVSDRGVDRGWFACSAIGIRGSEALFAPMFVLTRKGRVRALSQVGLLIAIRLCLPSSLWMVALEAWKYALSGVRTWYTGRNGLGGIDCWGEVIGVVQLFLRQREPLESLSSQGWIATHEDGVAICKLADCSRRECCTDCGSCSINCAGSAYGECDVRGEGGGKLGDVGVDGIITTGVKGLEHEEEEEKPQLAVSWS